MDLALGVVTLGINNLIVRGVRLLTLILNRIGVVGGGAMLIRVIVINRMRGPAFLGRKRTTHNIILMRLAGT